MARQVRQAGQAMGHRLARLPPLRLLVGDGPPVLVYDALRLAVDALARELEVLRPETQPCLTHETLIARDDIDLGVVEQGVVVEVCRAHGEPAIVDQTDLGVHVDGPGESSFVGVQGGGQETSVAILVEQRAQLAARVVATVVRPRRQQKNEPECIARRMQKLLAQDGDDLGRPEELVLEVDQTLGGPQRA